MTRSFEALLTSLYPLPVGDERIAAFCDKWLDLNDHMGYRTPEERECMHEISDAVMNELVQCWMRQHRAAVEAWEKRRDSQPAPKAQG